MIFDVIFALFILYGFYKGFSKGLINSFMAIFTYLLGFSIALKCSFPLLQKITQHFNINPKLAPIFSFILAFSLVVLVCQFILFFVEKALKATNLNFLNKQLGALVWTILIVLIFSVIVWIIDGSQLWTEATKKNSIVYPFLSKIAPTTILFLKNTLPYLKEVFEKLENFFDEKIIIAA